MPAVSQSYDELPYPHYAHPLTHPDNLATIATLFGLSPAPVADCRVLEIGCGTGGNLVPMAFNLPGSRFVGIDVSEAQIAEAGARAVAIGGLSNLELRHGDVRSVDLEGSFDFIVCHGVYSWVGGDVRAAILRVCCERLAPHGVACLSFNAYPGWHEAGMLRDMLRYHGTPGATPTERVARARQLLQFLAQVRQGTEDTRAAFLAEEAARTQHCDDEYLFYEYLEGDNQPFYLHELVTQVEEAGLQYLGDARPETMFVANLDPPVVEALARCRSVLEAQQYRDFVVNCRFRTALLCRPERAVNMALTPERVAPLRVRARVQPDPGLGDPAAPEPLTVEAESGRSAAVQGAELRVALSLLTAAWPAALTTSALVDSVARRLGTGADELPRLRLDLLGHLIRLYFGSVVQLHSWHPPGLASGVFERPEASSLTRDAAARGRRVVTPWHEVRHVSPLTGVVLQHLDGSRDLATLVQDVERAVREATTPLTEAESAEPLAEAVAHALARLQQNGLLMGGAPHGATGGMLPP